MTTMIVLRQLWRDEANNSWKFDNYVILIHKELQDLGKGLYSKDHVPYGVRRLIRLKRKPPVVLSVLVLMYNKG